MTNREKITEKILSKSLEAKKLADQLIELSEDYNSFLNRDGNRKLRNSYQKIKAASISLMEVSFCIRKNLTAEQKSSEMEKQSSLLSNENEQ